MQLPVKFKYSTLDRGTVKPATTTELEYEAYLLIDENGVQIAASPSLGQLVAHAQQNDVTREVAEQFVARKMTDFGYLKGVDIDAVPEAPSGLMMPPAHMPQGSGGRGGPTRH